MRNPSNLTLSMRGIVISLVSRVSILLPFVYIVVISTTLQTSGFFNFEKQIIYENIFYKGSRTDPWGTPDLISSHSLNSDPTYKHCFLLER